MTTIIFGILIILLVIALDVIIEIGIGTSLWFFIITGIAKMLNIPLEKNKFWTLDVQTRKDAPKNTKLLFRFVEISVFLGLVLWVMYLLIYQNK